MQAVALTVKDHRLGAKLSGISRFETPLTFQDVTENGVDRLNRVLKYLSRGHAHIETGRILNEIPYRAFRFPEIPCDNIHSDAITGANSRDGVVFNVPVPRVHHFLSGRQVDPQLEAPHIAFDLVRHFLMYDATASRYPMNVSGNDRFAVPDTVDMFNVSVEDVGYRLDSPVRMPREAGEIVLLIVRMEIVKREERIETRKV